MSDDNGLWIDGVSYTDEDLTFREQRKVRDLIRELVNDPHFDPADASMADYLPALVTVIKQRTDSKYTVEQALDLKPGDLEKPKGKTGRPTKAGS